MPLHAPVRMRIEQSHDNRLRGRLRLAGKTTKLNKMKRTRCEVCSEEFDYPCRLQRHMQTKKHKFLLELVDSSSEQVLHGSVSSEEGMVWACLKLLGCGHLHMFGDKTYNNKMHNCCSFNAFLTDNLDQEHEQDDYMEGDNNIIVL